MNQDTYEYIDIHSHLNFPEFNEDREAIIALMKEKKIATITVGVDFKTSSESVELGDMHENIFATIGLHPADNETEVFDEKKYESLVKNKKVVAIGECGLDYARLPTAKEEETKKRQKDFFEMQIDFAVKHDKPLMIHCRDAYKDAIEILKSKKQEYGDKLRGNFHFFTSPIDIAKQCLELGFTVSFTGPITFVPEYADIVRFVPLDKMMIETDAPFAAPSAFRGKRNNPLYIPEMAKKIAEIRVLSLLEVKKQLIENTFHLFFRNS